MKLKNIVMIFVATFFAILLFSTISNAGYQRWNELTYEVLLNKDGSMDVTEVWDIYVEETNTLFKEFDKGANLTNITVEEVLNEEETKSFKKIDKYMYHVTKDCYYGLKNKKGNYEIAWGVSINNRATRKYVIKYTVLNAITSYNDCDEMYWQFLSKDNEIKANKINGTIKLPEKINNMEDLRVWAHGPLNGEITKQDSQTVKFNIDNLNTDTMLEVRVVTTQKMFSSNTNIENHDKLSNILVEETRWADEANRKREQLRKQQEFEEKMFRIFCIAFSIIGGILLVIVFPVLFIRFARKYNTMLKTLEIKEPEKKVDYFRDIPNSNTTPAGIGFIHYLENIDLRLPNIFTATLLDLCLKKCIEFKVQKGINGKEEISIEILENNVELKESEKIVYDLLKEIANENVLTMSMIEKYAKNQYKKFNKVTNKIKPLGKEEQIKNENYDEKDKKNKTKWENTFAGYLVGTIFIVLFEIAYVFLSSTVIPNFMIALPIILLFEIGVVVLGIVNTVLCYKISSRYSVLTQKGLNEKELWKGLKKYMEDFSIIDERELPELKVWEEYLIYATVFGIADKVLKQLKMKYPQIEDENYMMNNHYAYMYLLCHNNTGTNFINSVSSSMNRAYANSSYSSGSGGGGGFSSGGGFGGGGGHCGGR